MNMVYHAQYLIQLLDSVRIHLFEVRVQIFLCTAV